MTRFLFTQERSSSFSCPVVVEETENRQLFQFFISAAESALAGIAARVPVGSGPELSHKTHLVIGRPENHRSLARATPNGTSAPGNWCRAVQQSRIRLLSFRQYNMRRVLRGLVLCHRKSQRAQVNAAKKCLTLTEGNR